MNIPNEKEILETVDSFKVDSIYEHKVINITVVDKSVKQNLTSNNFTYKLKVNVKKFIKYILFFIYRVIKKVVRTFLRIVDPRILDIIRVQDNLREENQLLKIQLLKLKAEKANDAK